MHTLIKILHKHIGNLSNVLCWMHLGVTDELPSEFPQLHHVKTSCEFDVLNKLRKLGCYNNVRCISIEADNFYPIRNYDGNTFTEKTLRLCLNTGCGLSCETTKNKYKLTSNKSHLNSVLFQRATCTGPCLRV